MKIISCLNVSENMLFNAGYMWGDILDTVHSPDILKHQLRWYKGVQHVPQVQLPQTAAVVPLPLPLHAAKALLRQNPFAPKFTCKITSTVC
jgi:hypothetical protein